MGRSAGFRGAIANYTRHERDHADDVLLGDQDYRTPPADGGGDDVPRAEIPKFRPSWCAFPRGHELSHGRQASVERLNIVGWMDQWLQGKKNPAFDERVGATATGSVR
jgi:hypothetical protein